MAGLYDARWQKAARLYLEAHPLCVDCLRRGIKTRAAVVDHIVPHRDEPKRFWNPRNWQPLCKPCHDVKTARQDGGFGRAPSDRPLPGGGRDGLPTDPGHPWSTAAHAHRH